MVTRSPRGRGRCTPLHSPARSPTLQHCRAKFTLWEWQTVCGYVAIMPNKFAAAILQWQHCISHTLKMARHSCILIFRGAARTIFYRSGMILFSVLPLLCQEFFWIYLAHAPMPQYLFAEVRRRRVRSAITVLPFRFL